MRDVLSKDGGGRGERAQNLDARGNAYMSNRPIKILLVEDNPGDARLIQANLVELKGQRFHIVHADRLSTALEYLSTDSFDVVLLDLGLPDSRGIGTFKKVQASAPRVPVVILAALEDDDFVVQMARAGLQDYLLKSRMDGGHLERSILYAIERRRLYDVLEKYRGKLEEKVLERTAMLKKLNEQLMLDIVERKRTEEKVRESERRFRELQENIDLIAVSLDMNGEITFCNDYLLKLTGWKREDVMGRNWFDVFIPAEQQDLVRTFFNNLIESDMPSHEENEIVTRDGERRLIRWNNTLLHGIDGKTAGITSIGEDVTW